MAACHLPARVASFPALSSPVSATQTFRLLGTVFAALGSVLWCVALALLVLRVVFLQSAERVEGQVVSVSGGVPTVQFQPASGRAGQPTTRAPRLVEGSISSSPPALTVGERVDVYYRAGKPDDAQIGSLLELWFVPMLLGAIGAPFLAIGSGFMLIVSQRTRRDSELRSKGRRLTAKVVALEPSLLRINRRPAHILIAESREPDGQTRRYRSDALLVKDSDWIGRQIVVYVDPHDPTRYSLDLHPT